MDFFLFDLILIWNFLGAALLLSPLFLSMILALSFLRFDMLEVLRLWFLILRLGLRSDLLNDSRGDSSGHIFIDVLFTWLWPFDELLEVSIEQPFLFQGPKHPFQGALHVLELLILHALNFGVKRLLYEAIRIHFRHYRILFLPPFVFFSIYPAACLSLNRGDFLSSR